MAVVHIIFIFGGFSNAILGLFWCLNNFIFVIKIYPDGIRHIRSDKRVNEWKTPGKKTIEKCAVNQRQVVIALTGGELVYFEMDPVSGITN